jgi:hypothetical protein
MGHRFPLSYGAPGTAHLHQNNDSSIDIVLSAPVATGQKIHLNDDIAGNNVDNYRLLEIFGMLLSKRSFTYAVSVSLDKNDPMYGNKREMFDKYFRKQRVSPVQTFSLDGKQVPRELLFALRVYNAGKLRFVLLWNFLIRFQKLLMPMICVMHFQSNQYQHAMNVQYGRHWGHYVHKS